MQLTGGEIVVESLIRAGVPYVVGVPGHGILGVLDALIGREERLGCIRAKQDTAAVHIADGYFRATGTPLAVLASVGPGAINTASALATSYMDSTTVLCITGAPHTYMVGKGVVQEIERGRRGHAFPDVLAPVVKRQWCVVSTQQLTTVMQRAFTEMLTGRCGPVHIDLPVDVQCAHGEVTLPEHIVPPEAWTVPAAGEIEKAAAVLHRAHRPVIVAGGGVLAGGAATVLRSLAEVTGAGVATTAQAKSALPGDHPLCLGVVAAHGSEVAVRLCRTADVLLAVGCRFGDLMASSYRHGASFGIPPTQLIHLDVDPREIGKNYRATLGLVGDARRTLHAVREAYLAAGPARDYAGAAYTREIADARAAWDATLAAGRGDETEPVSTAAVLEETREFLDDDAFVVSAVGDTQTRIVQAFPFYVPGTHVTTTGFATPGFTLPAALGVKLGQPDRQVLGICGDGDFLQSVQELATAVEHGIPVVLLVCNSGGWLGLRTLQGTTFGAARIAHADFATPNGHAYLPDVAGLAAAFGCHAQRIASAEEVQTALAAAFASEQPAVVECRVRRDAPPPPAPGWWDVPVPAYLQAPRAEYEAARAAEHL